MEERPSPQNPPASETPSPPRRLRTSPGLQHREHRRPDPHRRRAPSRAPAPEPPEAAREPAAAAAPKPEAAAQEPAEADQEPAARALGIAPSHAACSMCSGPLSQSPLSTRHRTSRPPGPGPAVHPGPRPPRRARPYLIRGSRGCWPAVSGIPTRRGSFDGAPGCPRRAQHDQPTTPHCSL